MCAPADSCRKGTRRMPCSSSAASSGSISGDGRPKTNRTPSFARQRASSRPPFSSAIGHLLVRLAALVAALARGGPDVLPALTAGDGSPFSPQGGSSNVGRAAKSRRRGKAAAGARIGLGVAYLRAVKKHEAVRQNHTGGDMSWGE